jgi:hypothetical protein
MWRIWRPARVFSGAGVGGAARSESAPYQLHQDLSLPSSNLFSEIAGDGKFLRNAAFFSLRANLRVRQIFFSERKCAYSAEAVVFYTTKRI